MPNFSKIAWFNPKKSIAINIINLSSDKISSEAGKKIKRVSFLILKLLDIQRGYLNINLVCPARMQNLNKKHRRKNKTSSILSFAEPKNFINPPALFPLGEIFLCPTKIKNEAKELKISYETRLIQLLIHGMLHLVGYAHNTKKREQLMQKKEKCLWKKLNIKNQKLK